ncbi:MAG: hypothetical protein CM15mP68_1830 [Pseudomonadota bacterium]|nr:MAG: hypothetical protein CM15mP68_1830 [Pseudomonadota bacterium]
MKGFTSKIVHSDRQDGIEHGAVHKPIHDSVAFGFDDAHELAAVFQGVQSGYTYGRQVNPTVTALKTKSPPWNRVWRRSVLAPVWPLLAPPIRAIALR